MASNGSIKVENVEHLYPLVTIYETQTDAPIQIESVDMPHYMSMTFERNGLKDGDGATMMYWAVPVGDEWREEHEVPPPLLSSGDPDYVMPPDLEAEMEEIVTTAEDAAEAETRIIEGVTQGVSQALEGPLANIASALQALAAKETSNA